MVAPNMYEPNDQYCTLNSLPMQALECISRWVRESFILRRSEIKRIKGCTPTVASPVRAPHPCIQTGSEVLSCSFPHETTPSCVYVPGSPIFCLVSCGVRGSHFLPGSHNELHLRKVQTGRIYTRLYVWKKKRNWEWNRMGVCPKRQMVICVEIFLRA